LGSNSFRKDSVVLNGPPMRLSGPKITDIQDNLFLDKKRTNLLDMEKSITGPTNVDCGNYLMLKH
jgi:hypothetical protein